MTIITHYRYNMLNMCNYCYSILKQVDRTHQVTESYNLNTVDITYTKSVSLHDDNSSTARIIKHNALWTKPTITLQFFHWLLRF